MAPPEGCSYIFDHYVTNSKGDCCASMCYAVDSDGAKCAVINVENEIDIADPGNEGDLCTDEQKNASDCPIAMCSPAPNGCTYIDKYVMSDYGECCPRMCYAVDSDGNECNFDDNDPNPSIEGEICTADDEKKNPFDCPIAMCSPAPNGCTYIDKYIMSKYGECCPSLCYAVDSDGNECNFDDNDPNPSIEGELCTADDEQKN
eukprot:1009227_1